MLTGLNVAAREALEERMTGRGRLPLVLYKKAVAAETPTHTPRARRERAEEAKRCGEGICKKRVYGALRNASKVLLQL